MKHTFRSLFPSLDKEQMTETEFYNAVLELLQYSSDTHYRAEDAPVFAGTLGLNPLHKAVYSGEEIEEKLCEALRIKNRYDKNCIEYLAQTGALDGWNAHRDIPEILEFDGKLQPIFDYGERIFERVFVESPQDTDQDGKLDLIAVYIIRPKETAQGMKVPAFYVANPYMLGGDDDKYVSNTHNVDLELPELAPKAVSYDDIKYRPEKKCCLCRGRQKEWPQARLLMKTVWRWKISTAGISILYPEDMPLYLPAASVREVPTVYV